jgi:hypothetical protein
LFHHPRRQSCRSAQQLPYQHGPRREIRKRFPGIRLHVVAFCRVETLTLITQMTNAACQVGVSIEFDRMKVSTRIAWRRDILVSHGLKVGRAFRHIQAIGSTRYRPKHNLQGTLLSHKFSFSNSRTWDPTWQRPREALYRMSMFLSFGCKTNV